MPVTDITKDLDNRVLTITAEFAAPVQRVWDLYADARQLEQVWGPPTHPATFVDHELAPGTTSTYYMTSPEGERFYGVWQITGVDAPDGFTFDDAFADEDFTVNAELPVSHAEFAFDATDAGTRAGLHDDVRVRRGPPEGARHGDGGGRARVDQPDRRLPRRQLNPRPLESRGHKPPVRTGADRRFATSRLKKRSGAMHSAR